jgi:hypothetical protein
MGAEPFIEPPPGTPPETSEDPARLWAALAFIGIGLAACGALVAWMGPISAEAQANAPVPAIVVAIERSTDKERDRTAYRIEWTARDGAKATGRLHPLIEEFRVGQTVAIRYAYAGRAQPHLFLDTPLELWGPVTGVALLCLAPMVALAAQYGGRLVRARRARARTPGSDPSP